MKSFVKSKSFLLVLGFSAIYAMGMWFNNEFVYFRWWPTGLYVLDLIITLVQLPAYILACMVAAWLYGSKNPDAPDRIAYYILIFFTYVLILSGFVGLSRLISKHAHNKHKK